MSFIIIIIIIHFVIFVVCSNIRQQYTYYESAISIWKIILKTIEFSTNSHFQISWTQSFSFCLYLCVYISAIYYPTLFKL